MLEELERELRGLLHGEHSSLQLTFNDGNGPNYMTVQEYLERGPEWVRDISWVSEEERRRAIEANSMWELHWYPETPVGFHRIAASSLPALIAGMREHSNG